MMLIYESWSWPRLHRTLLELALCGQDQVQELQKVKEGQGLESSCRSRASAAKTAADPIPEFECLNVVG